jgi:hypothetical protein
MTRNASCCCGACSIEVEGEPAINAICHCSNCKKRSGSAFGWSAYFADTQILRKLGDLKLYAISGASRQQRSFCATCGTTLFWKSEDFPEQTGIAGGCFVDHPLETPTLTVSNERRCAWVSLPKSWRTSF